MHLLGTKHAIEKLTCGVRIEMYEGTTMIEMISESDCDSSDSRVTLSEKFLNYFKLKFHGPSFQ